MAIQQKAKAGGSDDGSRNGASDQSVQQKTRFIQETITELKKTTWPSKQEATRLTSVVIGVIVVLSIYMGLLDAILSFLVSKFSLIK